MIPNPADDKTGPRNHINISINQIRVMIGLRVSHRGRIYTVIEVIADSPAIILEPDQPSTSIQVDLRGIARRQTRQPLTILVLNHEHTERATEFLAISLL
jgi:hypothetical protein